MTIRELDPAEYDAALELVDAALRPAGAATSAREDFPLALGPENLAGWLVAAEGGRLAGCLNCLIRPFATSLGRLDVAAVGSVVTRPDRRGRGLSGRLQASLLERLRARGVPLAVLWSDRPGIYAGRGFRAAGLENHAELPVRARGSLPAGWEIRSYLPDDAAAVARAYRRHALRTLRAAGEDALLYGMRGTRGHVLRDVAGELRAYAFCGKGADFPGYVLEWGGDEAAVEALVGDLAARGEARHLLVPQGCERLLTRLRRTGARCRVRPSGLWAVLDQAGLERAARRCGVAPPTHARDDARSWLGGPDRDGAARPGPLALAVWGFDSI